MLLIMCQFAFDLYQLLSAMLWTFAQCGRTTRNARASFQEMPGLQAKLSLFALA